MSQATKSTLVDPQRTIAELRRQLDECRAELAARNSEFGERIEHQSATIDVLKAMSASPGDPQPVFDLIVRRARELCATNTAALYEFDGELVHLRSIVRHAAYVTPDASEAYDRLFPMVPTRGSITCRAILDRQTVHVRDFATVPGVSAAVRNLGNKSQISLPLLRDGAAIGAMAMASGEIGGFSESQVALLQTFAEQAVIAITSAETYRELQQRTGDLQESLEYQTATSDVLKVISRSTFDLQPILDTLVETGQRLCDSDTAALTIREDDVFRYVATRSLDPAWDAFRRARTFAPNRETVAGRAALTGEVVHVPDITADPDYRLPEAATLGKLRTMLGVPLLRDGLVVGTLGLGRRGRVAPFTERQIELVRTFADQAVIAIENARLLTELRESLEQQTATAEVLQVINSSPGELQPVFEAILEKAHTHCGATRGALLLFDGETFRAVAMQGFAQDRAEHLRRGISVRQASYWEPLLAGAPFVHIPDMRLIDNPVARAAAERGVRTNLLLALRKDGALLGMISCGRDEVRLFSDKEIAFLENFAAQAVIAMENARLLGELQARTRDLEESLEYQTATSDVLNVISRSTADVQPVLDTVAETAARLCDADLAAITIRDGEAYRYVSMSTSAAEPEFWATLRQRRIAPGRDSLVGRVLLEGRAVHIEDIRAEPDFAQPEAVASGRRTVLGVPLLREGVVLGTISLVRKRVQPFTERQIELIRTFADQAVIAMENARLLGELRERTRDLEESLEYQTATSDVLNVISRSTADVQPVLDTVAETAARLCGADRATIFTREGEVYRAVSTTSADPEHWAIIRQRRTLPGRETVSGRVLLEGRVVQIADIRADPDFAVPEALAGGNRTMLGVPLLREGAVLGTINLSRMRVEPFTERQIDLVRTFADQAVIAMENARLLGELQARTRDLEESLEYQTATSDVLKVIARSTADVQPVLDTVAETASRLCDSDTAAITIREGEVYRYVASNQAYAADAELWAAQRQRTIVPGRDTSIAGRVALEGRVVHVADIRAIPDYYLPEAAASGLRTVLGVPLLHGGAVLGAITLARKRIQPYTERQIELVRTFADQAVIAMENARLLGELRERTRDLEESLEYQTATSDVLNVISRSTADVQPVLDTVIETAVRLCGADTGSITIREGDVYRWMAGSSAAANPEYWAIIRQRTIVPGRASIAARVALEGRVVHIEDRAADPDYALPEVVAAGDRTGLGVPLMREGAIIGTINLGRKRVEPFTERQIELVRTFADQAVIAIENARLLGELQARTDELTRSVGELQALEEVLRAVNSSLDLDTVLATIISRAAQLSQADEGTIYEYDETEEVFVPKSAFGMSAERVAALRERKVKMGETHLGRAAVERAPVYVDDVQQDPTLSGPDRGGLLEGIHAVLAVPLLREDKVVGGLVIRRRTAGGFAPTIPTLLQTFAGQAVLAIENARLFQELMARGEEARRARTAAEAALADLRRAQDRLIQSEKMASLGQLTAGIAHEIKNPLNFVNNFAGLSVELLDELKEAADPGIATLDEDTRAEIAEVVGMLTGNLEKIAEHGRRADGIVKSMLEHSRGVSGERREVDLNTLVDEALNLAYHGARAQDAGFNITLEREFDPAAAPIELAPQEITRVFLNLFGNGFYAATKRAHGNAGATYRPTLQVSTRDLGEAVEVRVRDNGTGIPPEIRDQLFQPFFTTKPTGEGTGLGLSISWDIVTQQHGGTIAVDSREGEFTEFTIRLPRTGQAAGRGA